MKLALVEIIIEVFWDIEMENSEKILNERAGFLLSVLNIVIIFL